MYHLYNLLRSMSEVVTLNSSFKSDYAPTTIVALNKWEFLESRELLLVVQGTARSPTAAALLLVMCHNHSVS